MSSAITTTTADFFWKPENNRVDPSTLASKWERAEVPADMGPWEMVEFARAQGIRVSLGTARTGVFEIVTNEGCWTRQGSNRRARSSWTFLTNAQIDAQ